MKKNPLEEIYTSKVLVSESVPSNKVTSEKELDDKINGKKARPVAGQGPEACKKDLEAPKEMHGTEVHEPKVLKDSMEKPTKSFEGSFEKLFKATINEQFPGEEEMSSPEMEIDVEVPTSNDDMMDELEGETDEVSDLVSDLKDLMSKLQTILDKVSEESGSEEETGEEMEMEFGDDETAEDELEMEDEEPVKEATELKPLGDKSKILQNKNNKAGSVKPHGGKAHGGNVESDPKLKPAKPFNKALQSPKGKAEVGNVKKGEFFK
jgi:hypothetical protein